jgi:hypothetical protein
VQKCAFACAGLTDNGHHFSALDIEAEIAKKGEFAANSFVGLLEAAHVDDGQGGRFPQIWCAHGEVSRAGDRWDGLRHRVTVNFTWLWAGSPQW